MNVRNEIEDTCEEEDVETEKEKKQEEFMQAQPKDDLLMFEKGEKKKKKKRRAVEEYSSDDEDDCQWVCNMTGRRWESFPFPIIVDSGVCVSVMPPSWCEHVPIRETQQSKAGE